MIPIDRGEREPQDPCVKELRERLQSDHIDVALHCLEDLPTRLIRGLTYAAYLQRQDPRDALLSRVPWQELHQGAVLGTGSLRRSAQLAAVRPDFKFRAPVGALDTRLRKLMEGEYDAIVCALADLNRLGLGENWALSPYAGATLQPLGLDVMLPAPGQAILILECSDQKQNLIRRISSLDHPPTRAAATAERTFLSAFGSDSSSPVAALAVGDQGVNLLGLVASPDGKEVLRGTASGIDPVEVGGRLAAELIGRGALDLFQTVSSDTGGDSL